tara:strand:+ start:310 stop:693 length:384 start_codon:yes stop_codon:yes gene_type:complete
MESLKLKQIARKLKRQENKKVNAKFNFGTATDGRILTSTSNAKAHTYNKLIRESNALRDANFSKMLEAFNAGEVAVKTTRKISKGFRKNMYKQSIKNANDTKSFIKSIAEFLSEECNGSTIYLCQLK